MLSHKDGSKMHDQIANAYCNCIKLMEAEGVYNAAILNGARQFLRDNNVLMDSGVGTPLEELNKTIKVPFGDEYDRDAAEA